MCCEYLHLAVMVRPHKCTCLHVFRIDILWLTCVHQIR